MRIKPPIVTQPIMNTINVCQYSFGIVKQHASTQVEFCALDSSIVSTIRSIVLIFLFSMTIFGLIICKQIKIVREDLIKGYQVYCRYNEKNITAKHNKVNHYYQLLGFGDEKKADYSIGYVDGNYRAFEISYSDYFESNDHLLQGCVNLFCFRMFPLYILSAWNLKQVYSAFCDYYYGRFPLFEVLPAFQSGDIVVGQKAWDFLPNHLEMCDLYDIDTRDLHAFMDYKAGMIKRIGYLRQIGALTDPGLTFNVEDIKKNADIAFLLVMKCVMAGDKRAKERAAHIIRQVR